MSTETLAPPLFPYAMSVKPAADTDESVVPFGITTAIPANPRAVGSVEELSLCPERQITVTQDGVPFISTPSMASSFDTVVQTQEDMQVWDDDEGTDED
ncbi:putative ATP-grasp-modified RiPP [Streptomyces aidingensis]|uniref:Putative ATP-grasp target RiPP n=1 Tax=Streptomyces aidingensis TaxID=910347 RepID=A0A1I1J9C9_9ACTN|nr:putative ATP-grasp-modified RiPP [Streptomyces aidingensis]SFC44741.1 putative ATP-grasp target RiPP [Streptomyces aidingensis]